MRGQRGRVPSWLLRDGHPCLPPANDASDFLLLSARQHPSYGDCLEVQREYYQNCSVLDCVTVSNTLILTVVKGQTDWVCHIGTLTLCIETVA